MNKPNVLFRFQCPYCREPYDLTLDILETDDGRAPGAWFAETVASHLEQHLSRRCGAVEASACGPAIPTFCQCPDPFCEG